MKHITTRQKRFADAYLQGQPAGRAWEMAGYRSRGSAADVKASQALKHRTIRHYIKQEQQVLNEAARIDREQLLDWLCRVVLTPIGHVDEHSDLPQRYKRQVEDGKTTYLDISMPSKIDAVKMICHLCGFGPPSGDEKQQDPLCSLLLKLRNPSQN